MNIQRFSASTMRGAMVQVRRQLGAEAVIVHSASSDHGVEVIAALDYDETLAGLPAEVPPAAQAEQLSPRREALDATVPPVALTDHLRERRGALDAAARVMGKNAVPDTRSRPTAELTGDEAADDGAPSTVKLYNADGHERIDTLAAAAASVRANEPPLGLATSRPENSGVAPVQVRAAGRNDRLDDVGAELRSLRTLMEQQLSGLAWQDVTHRDPQRALVLHRLLDFGLAPSLCTSIANAIHYRSSLDDTWREALAELTRRIPLDNGHDVLAGSGVVALVGPTGVGKTTTIAKLAGSYILRHGPGSVGLVTTDDYRLGAREQLQAFGRVLDITVAHATDGASLLAAVRAFQSRSLVLIDTEGARERIDDQGAMLETLASAGLPLRVFLVLAANTQRAALSLTAEEFGRLPLGGAIITKADECGTLGDVLSTVVARQLPVAYLSDGQQVPHDLHAVNADDLVSRGDALLRSNTATTENEILGLTFGKMVASAHG